MIHASSKATKMRINNLVLSIPKPKSVKNSGHGVDNQKTYIYEIPLNPIQLRVNKLSPNDAARRIRDEFNYSCDCEHDCCGCLTQTAFCKMQDNALILTVFAAQNY